MYSKTHRRTTRPAPAKKLPKGEQAELAYRHTRLNFRLELNRTRAALRPWCLAKSYCFLAIFVDCGPPYHSWQRGQPPLLISTFEHKGSLQKLLKTAMLEVEELDSPNAVPPKTPPPNYGQATALPPKPRFAAMLPPDEPAPELDETTKQQLRAVFAACDDGRGLDAPRTREAVRALGLGDGEAAVDRFLAARGGARFLSCDAFCEAAAAELDRARGAEPELLKLLALFDDGGAGTLDRETLRHLLCDFASPERLTPDEFDELDLGNSVDYRAYVRSLMATT